MRAHRRHPSTRGLMALFATAFLTYAIAADAALSASAPSGRTWVACAADSPDRGCSFKGNLAIQTAIDHAVDGDTIRILAGTYVPEKLRDVPFTDGADRVILRAFLVVEGKSLRVMGEPGAVIDGSAGPPATAMVVNGARIDIDNLTIRNFRVLEKEDNIYDGHGIFVIDSAAVVTGVTFERIQKMGLSVRGASDVSAANLRMHDGHVGIWVRESAQLRLCSSIIRDNDGLGAGAAGNGSLRVYNSVLDHNADDGLYAKEHGVVFATNSIITHNRPFGARAEGTGQLWVRHSVLFGNEGITSSPAGKRQVNLGAGIRQSDPRLDRSGRPAAAGPFEGDLEVRDRAGAPSRIGVQDIAGCALPPRDT